MGMHMTDVKTVLQWAHLGAGRTGRAREIVEAQRRISRERVEEIWAEQEALDAARHWPDGPPLRVADRYAAGRPRWRPATQRPVAKRSSRLRLRRPCPNSQPPGARLSYGISYTTILSAMPRSAASF